MAGKRLTDEHRKTLELLYREYIEKDFHSADIGGPRARWIIGALGRRGYLEAVRKEDDKTILWRLSDMGIKYVERYGNV